MLRPIKTAIFGLRTIGSGRGPLLQVSSVLHMHAVEPQR